MNSGKGEHLINSPGSLKNHYPNREFLCSFSFILLKSLTENLPPAFGSIKVQKALEAQITHWVVRSDRPVGIVLLHMEFGR